MIHCEQAAFSLTETLARPGDGQDILEAYESQGISDAALLRHFGSGHGSTAFTGCELNEAARCPPAL